jgi:hypothetical protein
MCDAYIDKKRIFVGGSSSGIFAGVSFTLDFLSKSWRWHNLKFASNFPLDFQFHPHQFQNHD